MSTAQPAPRGGTGWAVALVGEFLFVCAVVALTGPGRIDIVDGQTRYEVARSLVEYGDSVVRDERVRFWVFPGRTGARYSPYRFPQSVLGAGAIVLADATGPAREARRHFFFTLTSAFCCALLALAYTCWFRRTGLAPAAALLWSLGGIFCTPSWFYGTSTFDDILGTAAVVGAICVAFLTRRRRALLGAAAAGLLLGLAFNCKEPLGIFVLAVLAANYDRQRPWRAQFGRAALAVGGLALGVAAYVAYDLYKFPPETRAALARLQAGYVPFWPGDARTVVAAVFGLTLSPGAGALWYFPPLALCLYGLRRWWPEEKWLCRAIASGCVVFFGFICCLTFFAGDPTWGPRYLTPLFAVLWLFAPAGAAQVFPNVRKLLLGLGLVVQLLAVSVDPHRLYIERGLPAAFYYDDRERGPWLYFEGSISHLLQRPRELVEVLTPGPEAATFTPAPAPTFAFPVINDVRTVDRRMTASVVGHLVQPGPGPLAASAALICTAPRDTGQAAVRRYQILNAPRPWWASQWYLPPEERPVDLLGTLLLLSAAALAGLGLLVAAARYLDGPAQDPGGPELGGAASGG